MAKRNDGAEPEGNLWDLMDAVAKEASTSPAGRRMIARLGEVLKQVIAGLRDVAAQAYHDPDGGSGFGQDYYLMKSIDRVVDPSAGN